MWVAALLVASVPVLTADELALPEGLPLERWRFQDGHDPAWSAPAFDDSSWTEVDPLFPPGTMPKSWNGYGWLRFRLQIDEPHPELALLIGHGSAIEIWADGKQLHVLDGKSGPEIELQPAARLLMLAPGREHVLAIRISDPLWRYVEEIGFSTGFSASIMPLDRAMALSAKAKAFSVGLHAFFFGVSVALGFLFIVLHLYVRERRHMLYFALLNFANASIEIASMRSQQLETFQGLQWLGVWLTFSVVIVSIMLMLVVRSLFFDALPRWYSLYAYAGVALNFAILFLPLPVLYLYALIGIGEGLRSLGLAIVKKLDGAWIIGVGFALVGLGVLVQGINDVSSRGVQESFAAPLGVLGLLLAMCVQLARDFAKTQREKLEQEKENARVQSEKMASLGRLVAGVAHEMNTPIGAMGSAHDSMSRARAKLESLIAEKGGDELKSDRKLATSLKVMEDSARVIEQGSERVAGIVDRLKSFARLDEAEVQLADLHRGIEDTIAMAGHELGDGIEVVRDFGSDLPEVMCRPQQLNQVLLNVLINAKQAGAKRIAIRTRAVNSRISIDIEDDGSGMSEETLSRVFEPGFTTRNDRVGMGFGLAIAQRVLKEHGGAIRIASKRENGTRVTLELPIKRSEAEAGRR
jgi:signal transduction histidine kinase